MSSTAILAMAVSMASRGRVLRLGAAMAAVLALAGCGEKPAPVAPPAPKFENGEVVFPEGSRQLAAFTMEQAVPGGTQVVELTGRIVWDEDRTVRIYPPLGGRVTRISAQAGDQVKAGQVLALMASPEFGQAQADVGKAQADFARDRFYYDNMLKTIGEHMAGKPQPLFVFLQTMAVHWPYDIAFEPGMEVPDGGDKNHPEMREYLRRLAISRLDLDYLKEQLRTRFPGEQFLLVQYGDHHAIPSAYLLGYTPDVSVQDMKIPPGYPYFTTFYSVDGVNYAPPRPPALESVDTAWLGAILLDAARLPLPESWRERLRLMQLCEGKSFDCKQRDEILKFHRRLIDSGLMQAK